MRSEPVSKDQLFIPNDDMRKASVVSLDVMVQIYGEVKRRSSCQPLDEEEGLEPQPDDALLDVRRKVLRYGVAMTGDERVKEIYRRRKILFDVRTKVCDISLFVACTGVLMAVAQVELTAAAESGVEKVHYLSSILCISILCTTVLLVALVISYNLIEAKIVLVETASDYWRVVCTRDRLLKVALEVLVCSICPLPGTGYLTWSYLERNSPAYWVPVPVNVLLALPMFLRSYLICRFIVLHSRQFQDAATRTIAIMNQIAVDFRFVLKTQLARSPLRTIFIFTVSFWVALMWMMTQCERYSNLANAPLFRHYLNNGWFVIVTFFSIGYGDVVPSTYCGRALAIFTGVVGIFVSSVFIAVISQKIRLDWAEKHVNQLRAESHLTLQIRNGAARVLQYTWQLHKWKKLWNDSEQPASRGEFKVRLYQRLLLQAIIDFRRLKRRKRFLAEQMDEVTAFKKFHHDMQDHVAVLRREQEELSSRLRALSNAVGALHKEMLPPTAAQQQDYGRFHAFPTCSIDSTDDTVIML